ncbi:MAG: right-handed parallel beta-helix repeat-containing protein [Acidobacteria bacterium]|nr:right-handed parallel beta-helix repeat-containing protein [Acidobacteriota bacterium]
MNLFSGPENTNNEITDNDVTGNHWGILLGNFAGNSGNTIRNNRVRNNGRAGIAALTLATGNTIEGNDVSGNALLNIGPSFLFDLFDAPPLDNTWRNNQGRFNLVSSSALTTAQSAAVMAEAFGPGGCLAPARQR